MNNNSGNTSKKFGEVYYIIHHGSITYKVLFMFVPYYLISISTRKSKFFKNKT